MQKAVLFNRFSRSPRKLLGGLARSGARIVDVGCGSMWKSMLYVYLPRREATMVGLERAADATIYGSNRLPDYIASTGDFTLVGCDIETERLPFEDATVDGVFFSHVIEHVADRPRIVGEIARILKPGGVLYVETPGPRSLVIAKGSKLFREGDPYPLNYRDDPTHLGDPMSLDELRALLTVNGFSIERAGMHREFGTLAMPLYGLAFVLGLLPLPRRVRTQLLGFGWWNLAGWAIYAIAKRRLSS